ncbi:hypothetical protein [Nevskia sp.]|uniref:hypothetical protein n=1 Tax=Nevskia sp. TaxID=1929292 RepID=UPI0025FB25CF|nr:hypothetical protein [Nevskia sp.]
MNAPVPPAADDPCAPPRALGINPLLRKFSVVIWAGFLGATVTTIVVALMPEHWLLPPVSPQDQAQVFGLIWLLSLIPALAAGVLYCDHPRKPH